MRPAREITNLRGLAGKVAIVKTKTLG